MSVTRSSSSIVVAVALSTACAVSDDDSRCGPSSEVVRTVIDGDTVVLENGERVRYLLVNTPEITQGKNECYGRQASDFNHALVQGERVDLTYDQECRDRYGRLLAYVSVSGREVDSLLVERGYGCVMHIPPNGNDRVAELKALQAEAKAQRRGIWGACSPVPCAP